MHCPIPTCKSPNITAKRKFSPEAEKRMAKFKGINCYKRHYKCQQCGAFFATVELLEADFDRLQGHKLAQETKLL